MARVPREPPGREPSSSSPLVPTGLQHHSGWLGSLQPTCRLGPHILPPLLLHSMFLWLRQSLCLCTARVFLSCSPPRGLSTLLCSLPTQATKTAGHVPCVPAPSGLPVHLLIAWPLLAHLLTRRASCASGGLSTQLSSMRLLGLIVRCVLHVQRLLPQAFPVIQHCYLPHSIPGDLE